MPGQARDRKEGGICRREEQADEQEGEEWRLKWGLG